MSDGVHDLAYGDVSGLEDLVDRDSLAELCRSFFDLFGLSIRVLSRDGSLLTDVHEPRSICRYLNTMSAGRLACSTTVGDVQALVPEQGARQHTCFTGAVYQVMPVEYDGRRLGRIIVGPYLPAELGAVPQSLLEVDPELQPERARELLPEMPRVRRDTVQRILDHLRQVLNVILFSGHRAYMTSGMHLHSVRASYRELAEKNSRLQQAYDRLQELDRLKSNFLATVSHELRTPLSSIIGYADMLEQGIAGALNDEQRTFAATIRDKGELLLSLITALLDLNKLERGQLELVWQPVDPREVLRDVKETLLPHARREGVTVEVDCSTELPARFSADPVRLRQILINLANNAVKFTPDGGHVWLQAKAGSLGLDDAEHDGLGIALMAAPEPAVEFVVRDTGRGIPEESLEQIFNAFYQVDGGSTREHGGAGLGLAIVKKLVDAHGGDIRVDSVLHRGTTFRVILPEHAKR